MAAKRKAARKKTARRKTAKHELIDTGTTSYSFGAMPAGPCSKRSRMSVGR